MRKSWFHASRNSYIEEASFFFEGVLVMPTSDGRKLPIEDPDNKDHIPFQTFGAMDCRENEVVFWVGMLCCPVWSKGSG